MALLVDALLIAAAIGTGEDYGLSALGRLHLFLSDELTALFTDTLKQGARRLVGGVLRHEFALNGHLENRLAQASRQLGIYLFTSVFEPSVILGEGHEPVHALNDAVLLSGRRNRD